MARSLCLDVGARRIGLAVSDESKTIARPLTVIRAQRSRRATVDEVAAQATAQHADEVIVGLPLNADGSIGRQARHAQAFAEALRATLPLPVLMFDERYSTKDAQALIAQKPRRARDVHDDAIAAAVILQRYLDDRAGARNDNESFDE